MTEFEKGWALAFDACAKISDKVEADLLSQHGVEEGEQSAGANMVARRIRNSMPGRCSICGFLASEHPVRRGEFGPERIECETAAPLPSTLVAVPREVLEQVKKALRESHSCGEFGEEICSTCRIGQNGAALRALEALTKEKR
jgi:hypothetical protein